MNYYERHLGDYARDAGHLTLLEHGAYTLLLDRYYTTEHGIPADQAHRICRARTRDEKAAVDTVLAEFFTLADGVLVNSRAEREIAEYAEAAPDREAKKEHARERQRRTRERRKQLFEALRGHGIVPEYDTATTELQAMVSRVTSRHVTPPVTRDATATQTPDTSNQEIPIHLRPTVGGSGSPQSVAPPTPPPEFDGKNAEALNGKAVVPIAAAFELPDAWGFDAEALGWKPPEVLREGEKFRQYWTAGRGKGTRRSVKSWRQTWSNWLEKAAKDHR